MHMHIGVALLACCLLSPRRHAGLGTVGTLTLSRLIYHDSGDFRISHLKSPVKLSAPWAQAHATVEQSGTRGQSDESKITSACACSGAQRARAARTWGRRILHGKPATCHIQRRRQGEPEEIVRCRRLTQTRAVLDVSIQRRGGLRAGVGSAHSCLGEREFRLLKRSRHGPLQNQTTRKPARLTILGYLG
jgi:hypothetical protein